MANELQRQAYLSALGIENYMPRMILPFAPPSVVCELPISAEAQVPSLLQDKFAPTSLSPITLTPLAAPVGNSLASEILADVAPVKKLTVPINAASILDQFETKKAPVIEPFALSLWRPAPGFLIVDSRNSSLALPTELLLNNLLRTFLPTIKPDLREEVMRWPMIENRFVSRTADDARNELQTWLAVENELRPINRLWLMGDNAARYLLDAEIKPADVYWQEHVLNSTGTGVNSLRAIILPSLVELLQQPRLKAHFWASVK